jgi:tubby-related protein 1
MPPPGNSIVQLTILRDKDGIKNKFFPKYHVFFSENINQHILSVKKKPNNTTPNYVFSLSKEFFDRKSEYCVGKLRSNFVGTEFTLYNSGENPKGGDPT